MAKKKVVKKKTAKKTSKKKVAKKTVKKKAVKKKAVKKKAVKKVVKNNPVRKKVSSNSYLKSMKVKISITLFNLVLFAVLSIICYMLYVVTNEGFLKQTFYLFSIVLMFVSVAFLLLFLVLFFSKGSARKR